MENLENLTSENKKSKILISLRENYAANFGHAFRSSAIFWAVNNENLKTTISLSNYWLYKNNLDVSVVVNLRNMKGKLVSREVVSFENSRVKNYLPPPGFTGSVELEAFGNKNLRIPYAAAMAVYEAADSVSMVHSYARSYSQHEIEENRMISIGRESCWSLRDSHDHVSFCVIHNGSQVAEAQLATLRVRKFDGVEQSVEFKINRLEPFETIVIEPVDYFPDLPSWLEGEPGNARLSFRLGAGFTRMLCGVRTKRWSQLQVTHSNFDYSLHDTDVIESGDTNAYFYTPNIQFSGITAEIVVYPDRFPGTYKIDEIGEQHVVKMGEIYKKTYPDASPKRLVISREGKILPTRIVTALRLNRGVDVIPAECSLGVAHQEIPPKHFSWMLVSGKFNSTISWVDMSDVYGGCEGNAEFMFHLYSDHSKTPLIEKLIYDEIPNKNDIALDDLFGGNAASLLKDGFGYLTVWCSYRGFMFFSTLRKGNSISIEHCF